MLKNIINKIRDKYVNSNIIFKNVFLAFAVFILIYFTINYLTKEQVGFKIIYNFDSPGQMVPEANYIKSIKNGAALYIFVPKGNWIPGNSEIVYQIFKVSTEDKKGLQFQKIGEEIDAKAVYPIYAKGDLIYYLIIKNTPRILELNSNSIRMYNTNTRKTTQKTLPFRYSHSPLILTTKSNVLILPQYPQGDKDTNEIYHSAIIYDPVNNKIIQERKYISAYKTDKVRLDRQVNSLGFYPKCLNILNNGDPVFYVSHELGTKSLTRYDLRNNEFRNINIKEVDEFSHSSSENDMLMFYVWMGDNRFTVIRHPRVKGEQIFFNVYEIKNDVAVKLKSYSFKNGVIFHKNKFSTENYAVLNKDEIIFIGGDNGYANVLYSNKSIYLYDINQNKVLRLNNFPYKIKGQALFKIDPDSVLMLGGSKRKFGKKEKMNDVFIINLVKK